MCVCVCVFYLAITFIHNHCFFQKYYGQGGTLIIFLKSLDSQGGNLSRKMPLSPSFTITSLHITGTNNIVLSTEISADTVSNYYYTPQSTESTHTPVC